MNIFLIVVSLYFLYAASTPYEFHFIDGANLLIHEGGHAVTRLFGEFICVLSGSGFQVLVPLLFCGYFYMQREKVAAWICLLWAGESLHNVSIYAGDAQTMVLPLVGGDGTFHDWNYLLTVTGLLPYTDVVALTLRCSAWIVILAACTMVCLSAFEAPLPKPVERPF